MIVEKKPTGFIKGDLLHSEIQTIKVCSHSLPFFTISYSEVFLSLEFRLSFLLQDFYISFICYSSISLVFLHREAFFFFPLFLSED